MLRAEVPVLVFAKAPEPGLAKTRLAPALGEGGAAVLAARLLKRTLSVAREAAIGPVTLCCTPDETHQAFTVFARQFGTARVAQGPGDLGSRMHRALASALAHHEAAVLVGTDIPMLTAKDLRAAADALLAGEDVVLGPAEDGGYWLIGARRTDASLFAEMAWGTSAVFEQTCIRADALGWTLALVRRLRDMDRPEDLNWLAEDPDGAALVGDLLDRHRAHRSPL